MKLQHLLVGIVSGISTTRLLEHHGVHADWVIR